MGEIYDFYMTGQQLQVCSVKWSIKWIGCETSCGLFEDYPGNDENKIKKKNQVNKSLGQYLNPKYSKHEVQVLYSRVKNHLYSFSKRLYGLHGQCGSFGEATNILP